MKDKITVLLKIAQALNDEKVVWNLGGSCMLYFRTVLEAFNDIDIVVRETDIEAVKSLMAMFGEKKIRNFDERYKTRYFLQYQVDGVDIDIISGFTIVDQDEIHYFALNDNKNSDSVEINGINIYLEQLSVWLHYYKLMNRQDKVDLIESFIKNNKI